jgi:segregation and condensation protein B
MSLKSKIEAVLFLTAKPIKAQAMARIVNADVDLVRQALLELVHDYEERQGGLEIADDDGYSFQVKDEYASLMDEFLPVEMSAALIRTLSAIAIKQPIAQSEIIRIRGAGAYEHIKELVNRELVGKKEGDGGRSPILSTTKKFQEYFRLSKEGRDLRNYLKKRMAKPGDPVPADTEDAEQLVIPQVVSNPETDTQLNNQIFLETHDMAEAAAAAEAKADRADESTEETAPDAEVHEAAAAAEQEVAGEITKVDIPPPPEESSASAQPEEVEPVAHEKAPPAVEEPQPTEANVTLHKLAAAADVKEHEPIVDNSEPSAGAETDQAPPVMEQDDVSSATTTTRSSSTVQAHKAKDGPPIGNTKKKKSSKLEDLLQKQRELEVALEMAKGESAQQHTIDFTLPPAHKPDHIVES